MLKKLKSKSQFSRNVLILMTGTIIAQAIPIAISPILTRIYTPEDFGVFALYMSVVSILSVIATGQYELAIMLPKNEKDGLNILFLSIILTSFISFFLLLIVYFFNKKIILLLNAPNISNWLYLMPLSVLMVGFLNSYNYYFNRKKNYKFLSYNKIIQSSTSGTSSLILGFVKLNKIGLIISSFISQCVVVIVLIKKFDYSLIKKVSLKRIILLASRYKKFPEITLPHAIFNSISQNLPILIITKYFTSTEVGYYSFGNKIIMMPISLISSSYYQVFFQSFMNEKNRLHFYKTKFKQVNVFFLPLFVILWLLLPDVFSFVFGDKWEMAGEYSQIMLPFFYFKFLSNLFTTTTYIYYQKQFENFLFEIFITLIIFYSLMMGVYLKDIKTGLFFMMIGNCIVISIKLYRSFKFVKNE